MKTIIAWSLLFVAVLGILFYYSFQETDEDKECLKQTKGNSFVEAVNYAYTPQGCRVVQLTSYTGLCNPYYTVYVTECEGINVVTDPNKKKEKKDKEEIKPCYVTAPANSILN
jgi:hypothetical protein